MSDFERKGYQPDPDFEYGNGAATTARGQYDSAEDVFGNEEGAQVCEIHLPFQESAPPLKSFARSNTGP